MIKKNIKRINNINVKEVTDLNDLSELLYKAKRELFAFRLQKTLGQLTQVHLISKKRRECARLTMKLCMQKKISKL